jgi:voltage-gated potassium channel
MAEEKPFEPIRKARPGDDVIRRRVRRRRKLRPAPRYRAVTFLRAIVSQTPFLKMISLLIILWLIFSAGIYVAEHGAEGTDIYSYGRALYWGIAAFSTAGIASTPLTGNAQIVGGIWIVVGSAIFFGTIVATITTYFMRPFKHPVKQIIDTIEYNLEQLDDLSNDELDLLRETVDMLIDYIEQRKQEQSQISRPKTDIE